MVVYDLVPQTYCLLLRLEIIIFSVGTITFRCPVKSAYSKQVRLSKLACYKNYVQVFWLKHALISFSITFIKTIGMSFQISSLIGNSRELLYLFFWSLPNNKWLLRLSLWLGSIFYHSKRLIVLIFIFFHRSFHFVVLYHYYSFRWSKYFIAWQVEIKAINANALDIWWPRV